MSNDNIRTFAENLLREVEGYLRMDDLKPESNEAILSKMAICRHCGTGWEKHSAHGDMCPTRIKQRFEIYLGGELQ